MTSPLDFPDTVFDENNYGDYSTRMEELFDGGTSDTSDEDDQLQGSFVYSGRDATDMNSGYKDQLRDVLGTELTDDDEMERHEVEISLVGSDGGTTLSEDIPPEISQIAPSEPKVSQGLESAARSWASPKLPRPHLHPAVSRLRSYTPRPFPASSDGGISSSNQLRNETSPSPSHLSAISRVSSSSNLPSALSNDPKDGIFRIGPLERAAFQWTELHLITQDMYNSVSQKLSSVLGAPCLGTPTVVTANGLICIGTNEGKVCVYDFKQILKCICGNDSPVKNVGAVTALALSHDHTYVASGHATGHIQLFDLKSPKAPARLVPPTTWQAVASGRKEGHIQGSRIISIGFVAARHTVLVSADDRGLAFSHSLGKILFVEAPDILRILGKYQERGFPSTSRPGISYASTKKENSPSFLDTSLPRRSQARYSILEMLPLPLGTSTHATDAYNVVALLTPTKLVVVGLKPTPKTWFKRMREVRRSRKIGQAKFRGTMAWYPSILPRSSGQPPSNLDDTPTNPLLVYTWGTQLYIIQIVESRTKQLTQTPRTGQLTEFEVGQIFYEDVGRWSTEDDILAVQWLNATQIVVLTASILQVYDTQSAVVIEQVMFDAFSLVSSNLGTTLNDTVSCSESVGDISRSLRVYKGKIFLLARNNLRVGTLLTWADRILAYVQDGDFLSAIDLARAYYVGEAPGNRNGLPNDPDLCRHVIGERTRDLMVASTAYAFSEDRMTDGTHFTSDGRGVDRTALFENLVDICCRACVALEDFEFLFEDLFQQYDDAGISKIYLQRIEPFILDNRIRYVPPRITQRLLGLHEEDGHPVHAERIIWHIDPACLDINQAIHLCQTHGLYDALIHVYTCALRDCVAPIVELLGLIRTAQQYRKSKSERTDSAIESLVVNGYKVYPYLANILSGLSYPSEEPLPDDEAHHAKKAVYAFLFSGTSSIWPPSEGAKLILTSMEEGTAEPTYPYVRLLLSFDSEAFLHSLDIAFEDPHLNHDSSGSSRLVIIKILLEILLSGDLSSADATFVNIFIARNVPKYPQFIQLAPSALHGILIGLAEDRDAGTREDRQLAAEYLLSVYNPHESEHIIHIFQCAGFFNILRSWHRDESRWSLLTRTDLEDPDLRSSDLFYNLHNDLTLAARDNNAILPDELAHIISDAIPKLLDASVTSTAALINEHAPDLHDLALQILRNNDDSLSFLYLQHLFGPLEGEQEEDDRSSSHLVSCPRLSHPLRKLYLSLHCRYHPGRLIATLQWLPDNFLDWDEVLQICESSEAYHTIIWATNWRGYPESALTRAESYQKHLIFRIVEALSSNPGVESASIHANLECLKQIAGIGIQICRQYSTSETKIHLEDIWLQLLSSQINSVQVLSGSYTRVVTTVDSERKTVYDYALTTLRALVQSTFTSLVLVTSTRAVSFPRLFARLVDSASTSASTQYTEFRMVLTGMLESYRADGDMLLITKHLIHRDLFLTIADVVRQRDRGWAPTRSTCIYCRKVIVGAHGEPSENGFHTLVVSRTGTMYHISLLSRLFAVQYIYYIF